MLRRAALALVVVLLASGCQEQDRDAQPRALAERPAFTIGPYDDARLAVDVRELAAWGIETFESPEDTEPIVRAKQRSPLRLLQSQVRNLGVAAAAGNGTTGAELDALFSELLEVRLPMAELLAGYLQSDEPTAKRLGLGLDLSDPAATVFPDVALVAFSRDMVDVGLSQDANTLSSFTTERGTDVCAAAGSFFDSMFDGLFRGLDIARVDTSSWPKWLSWVGDGTNLVLHGLRAGLKVVIVGGKEVLLAPIRDIVGKLAAITAIVAATKTLVQPLRPTLTLSPGSPEFGVTGGDPLAYTDTLRVTTPAPTQWPPEVLSCAKLVNVTLPDLSLRDSPVRWKVTGNGAVFTVRQDSVLRDVKGVGVAELRLQTATEPMEWKERGPRRVTRAVVEATVTRRTKELSDALSRALTSLLGPLPDFLKARARGLTSKFTDGLIQRLVLLSTATARHSLDVVHHGPPEETPTPTPTPSPAPSPTATGAVWVHVERPAAAGVLRGRVLELVACDGRTWRGRLRTGGLRHPSDGFEVPWANLPVKPFTLGRSGTARTTADGIVIIPFPVERRVPLHYNLAISVSGRTMTVDGVPVEGAVSFRNIPIQKAPAGLCR